MNRQLIKTILGGALLGAALFYLPFFVLKVMVILLLIGFVSRFFGRRRGYRGPFGWAYADKIRNMSEEEYANFKERMSQHKCGHYHRQSNVQTNTDVA